MIKIISSFLLSLSFTFLYAQKDDFTRLQYFHNDSISCDLDLFLPSNGGNIDLPLMIFAHGGGFKNGGKGEGYDICRYLASQGFAAATIDYTLYMSDKSFDCDGQLTEKVKAIQIAVNQLWIATDYIIKNADKYHIDTTKIFISGSSAGGEMVLHAAFWDRKIMGMYGEGLSPDFKYAGLVSGAGAIMDINLITKPDLIPVMLFHGNADHVVPYGTGSHHSCPTGCPGWLMLFGSYTVFNRVCDLNGHAVLYTFCGGGHENSGTLFHTDMETISRFMKQVLGGRKSMEHYIIPTGKTNELSGEYGFCE
ncbi:MAG: alpha/beta hydrolase fold domain-containing protein [Bacteroidales bacterium]|nr:alpha/beta hydrolase fold domain-containing protein [Bacteroidales bacterium]